MEAAVDVYDFARRIAERAVGEHPHRFRDVFRLAHTRDGQKPVVDERVVLAFDDGGHVGFDYTGAHFVHAYAVRRDLISSVELIRPPLSWSEAVRTAAVYRFANAVNGALLHYDWTELPASTWRLPETR